MPRSKEPVNRVVPRTDNICRVPLLLTTADLKALPLGPEEAFVLSRVDGQSNERDIALATGLSGESVARHLDRLATLGAVVIPGPVSDEPLGAIARSPSVRPPEPARPPEGTTPRTVDISDEAALRNLLGALAGQDHYEALGVPRGADKAAIKTAYFNVVARFHPDRYYGEELEGRKPLLSAIFQRLTEAHDTLSRAKARAAYDATLQRTSALPPTSGNSVIPGRSSVAPPAAGTTIHPERPSVAPRPAGSSVSPGRPSVAPPPAGSSVRPGRPSAFPERSSVVPQGASRSVIPSPASAAPAARLAPAGVTPLKELHEATLSGDVASVASTRRSFTAPPATASDLRHTRPPPAPGPPAPSKASDVGPNPPSGEPVRPTLQPPRRSSPPTRATSRPPPRYSEAPPSPRSEPPRAQELPVPPPSNPRNLLADLRGAFDATVTTTPPTSAPNSRRLALARTLKNNRSLSPGTAAPRVARSDEPTLPPLGHRGSAHYVAAAKRSEAEGDLRAAVNTLRIARTVAPNDERVARLLEEVEQKSEVQLADHFLQRAQDLERGGDVQQAVQHYLKAARGKNSAQLFAKAARLAHEAGRDLKVACQAAKKAVDLEPEDANLRFLLGSIYSAAGMTASAATEFDKSRELAPQDKELLAKLKAARR